MPSPLRFRPSRYTPPRPWEPLSEAEWTALAPYVTRADDAPGRPLAGGARARLDAIFRTVATKEAWCRSGHGGVSATAVSRQFRRWAHAGLFARLLKLVAQGRRAPVPEALRALEHWICAAHRRSVRAVGVGAIALARRLGLLSALPGPPWMLPDPVLSRLVAAEVTARLDTLFERPRTPRWQWVKLRKLLRTAGGRRSIPRALVPA